MIDGKKILAVTLARGGSKKIPFKNLANIKGKPLIEYTFEEVKQSRVIDRYVVSTDDAEIACVCEHSSVEVHHRLPHLATDTASSADALIDVVERMPEYDYVVEVMCTNPLKKWYDIDQCLFKLNKTGADAVVSVVRIYDHHPSRVKFLEGDRLVDFYPEVLESRRQDLSPPAYVRNGSVYAMRRESLLTNRTRVGKDTRAYIMPEERSINIDEPVDLYAARFLMGEK